MNRTELAYQLRKCASTELPVSAKCQGCPAYQQRPCTGKLMQLAADMLEKCEEVPEAKAAAKTKKETTK